ncbi:MAG: hypothetical protein Q8R00_01850 [Candidatus Nanoarchaeia archaeon]|nr:hypothetical protein [Candidatus Nanoarchaeia archaeon]
MKHPISVEGFNGSLEDLVDKLGKMRFDILRNFLSLLSENLSAQADADANAGRSQLANQLYAASLKIYGAKDKIDRAYKISKPYMKDTNNLQ